MFIILSIIQWEKIKKLDHVEKKKAWNVIKIALKEAVRKRLKNFKNIINYEFLFSWAENKVMVLVLELGDTQN